MEDGYYGMVKAFPQMGILMKAPYFYSRFFKKYYFLVIPISNVFWGEKLQNFDLKNMILIFTKGFSME